MQDGRELIPIIPNTDCKSGFCLWFQAFFGHSWKGCSNWYTFPDALNADYGEPSELCTETTPKSGIFTREWSKASVKMDCNTYTGQVTMKDTGSSVFA